MRPSADGVQTKKKRAKTARFFVCGGNISRQIYAAAIDADTGSFRPQFFPLFRLDGCVFDNYIVRGAFRNGSRGNQSDFGIFL